MCVFLCRKADLSDVLQVCFPDRCMPGSGCITVIIYLASTFNNLKLQNFKCVGYYADLKCHNGWNDVIHYKMLIQQSLALMAKPGGLHSPSVQ